MGRCGACCLARSPRRCCTISAPRCGPEAEPRLPGISRGFPISPSFAPWIEPRKPRPYCRRLPSDPVRQALTSGAPVNLSRRALLLSRADGSERSIELSASPIRNETKELLGAAVLLHDVTELRGLARQMSYQATHDALTGLVNRREFEVRLEEAIDSGHRGDGQHVLCYLDLDRFKVVNDTSGHLAGDSMLREVAKVLRDAVRDSDTVGRLGGDEFGMLLIGCPLEKARQIADDVCRAVGEYRFVWKD